jgi:glycosyltransferase involved in cell wall biosynthesis
MEQECLSLNDLPPSDEVGLLLYHSSIGWQDVTDVLLTRTERMALSYHNITPAHFYKDHNPEFVKGLELGRWELQALKERIVLTVADSGFNAEDICAEGYRDVQVVPSGLNPSRMAEEVYDVELLGELKRRFPNGYVVAVGQILPHKRIEQLLSTMHLLNSTFWNNIGLVVCGIARQEQYWSSLMEYQSRTAMVDVNFAGSVSDRELATYIRGASAYFGMSDHEGFCIPPVEAASMGVPVVIKGAGAVPETMGDGALVLPADVSPVLAAEAINEVLTNNELRYRLIRNGYLRVKDLESRKPVDATVAMLLEAVA